MKIILNRKDDMYHLQATNEKGRNVDTDGAPEIGGSNKGMRPMQLILAAAGSCSAVHLISILKKQKQNLLDIRVEVTAEREKNKIPSIFTEVHLHYILTGDLDENKVKRAVELSVMKYCAVVKILEKTAQVTYTFALIK